MADELIAGKFKDDAALEQGVRELWKATNGVELPATAKIVGEGGIAADQAAAVALYKAMESNHGKLKAPPKPADTGVIKIGPQAPAPGTEIDDPAEAVKAAGIDWADIEKAVTEHGKPTDDHYAKLKAVGWNKAAVNAYVAGERASRQAGGLAYEAAVTAAGGRDKVKALVAEAEKHIPASEYSTYAKMLESPAMLPVAVKAMEAIVAAKKGNDFVTGSGTGSGAAVSTLSEYQSLLRKAAAGDTAAVAAIKNFDSTKIGSLK